MKKIKTGRNPLAIVLICFLVNWSGSAQKLQRVLTESWQTGNWTKYAQTTNRYDQNIQTSALMETWNGISNVWQNNLQTSYNKNVDGSTNIMVSQVWNPEINDWENAQRSTFTYDNATKVNSERNEMWISGTWRNVWQQRNTFDAGGFLTTEKYQIWDVDAKMWVNAKLTTYDNNSNGTANQIVIQSWNGSTRRWNNFQRTLITYNASDKPVTETRQNWTSGAWVNNALDTNLYDSKGYLASASTQVWRNDGSRWVDDTQYIYTNNPNGSLAQSVTQSWQDGSWNNELRFTFTYEALSPADLSVTGFSVYPNPAKDYVNVESDVRTAGVNYTIADQMGISYLEGTLNEGQTAIDVHPLAAGVYYINIGPEKQHSIKIVKE